MKLSKKLLPILAIVPTVATLSTSLTACSKKSKSESLAARKVALAKFDEIYIKAKIKENETGYAPTKEIEQIQTDLISFVKKTKNENLISSISNVAYHLANAMLDANPGQAAELLTSIWGGFLEKISGQDDEIIIVISSIYGKYSEVLKKHLDIYQQLMNKIVNDLINLILKEECSSEIQMYLAELVNYALSNEKILSGDVSYFDQLAKDTKTIIDEIINLAIPAYPIEKARKMLSLVVPMCGAYLNMIDYSISQEYGSFYLMKLLNVFEMVILDIKDQFDKAANIIAKAFTVYLNNSAAKCTSWELLNWNMNFIMSDFIEWIDTNKTTPINLDAFENVYESVFGNLLVDKSDIDLHGAITIAFEFWRDKIANAADLKETIAYASFLSTLFQIDKTLLYKDQATFNAINDEFNKSVSEAITVFASDALYNEKIVEMANLTRDFLFAKYSLIDGKVLELLSAKKDEYIKALQQEFKIQGIIVNSSAIFGSYAKDVLKWFSNAEACTYLGDQIFSYILNEIKNISNQYDWLSKGLVDFAANMLKSINDFTLDNEIMDNLRKAKEGFILPCLGQAISDVIGMDRELGPEKIKLSQLFVESLLAKSALYYAKNYLLVKRPEFLFSEIIGVFVGYCSDPQNDDYIIPFADLYSCMLPIANGDNISQLHELNNKVNAQLPLLKKKQERIPSLFAIAHNSHVSCTVNTDSMYTLFTRDMCSILIDRIIMCEDTQVDGLVELSSIFADENNKLTISQETLYVLQTSFEDKLNILKDITNKSKLSGVIELVNSWYKSVIDMQNSEYFAVADDTFSRELDKVNKL